MAMGPPNRSRNEYAHFAIAFCSSEGLDNVVNLSTMRSREFMRDYGVKIAGSILAGLTAHAVIVLGSSNVVRTPNWLARSRTNRITMRRWQH
jgi:peroxiredoxin